MKEHIKSKFRLVIIIISSWLIIIMVQLILCNYFNSFKLAIVLSVFDIIICISAFILNFILKKNYQDVLWLEISVAVFIFLIWIFVMEIYGILNKNVALVMTIFLIRIFVISLVNLACIIWPYLVDISYKYQPL